MKLSESTSSGPRVKLTLGNCKFEGIFACPCPGGSASEFIKDLRHDISCEKCGHALLLHRDHEKQDDSHTQGLKQQPLLKTEMSLSNFQSAVTPAPTPTATPADDMMDLEPSTSGVPLTDQEFLNLIQSNPLPEVPIRLCQRYRTVSHITRMLETRESVFVWGMSGSGKTTLANLLLENLKSRHHKVVFIEGWPEGSGKKKPEDILLEYARTSIANISQSTLLMEDVIFIIDEAQNALKQIAAWSTLVKNSAGGPRFCFFSNQGMFAERYSPFAIMPEISHLKDHGNGTRCVSLFFNKAEFQDFAQINSERYGYKLSEEGTDYVFGLTAGHPSLTSLVLDYIRMFQHYKSDPQIIRPELSLLKSEIASILQSDNRLFSYLGSKIYPIPLARESRVAMTVFKQLLSAPEKKIGWKSSYSTVGKCFVQGLICHSIDKHDQDVFTFPSPLHARWAQWYHKIRIDTPAN